MWPLGWPTPGQVGGVMPLEGQSIGPPQVGAGT
jgi:hypothetical protein